MLVAMEPAIRTSASSPEVPSRWQAHGLIDPPPRYRRMARLIGETIRPTDADVLRLRAGLMQGDPIADDFVAWAAEQPKGEGRRLFERAVEGGLAAVPDAPEPLVRWFAPLEAPPAWLEPDKLRLACRTAFRIGPSGGAILSAMALMGGYRSAAAVKPLAMTGALDKMVVRRIAETGRFVLDVYESGDMGRDTEGFRTTCRVRLMHAMVRRALRRRPDWDEAAWGVPINQTDTCATQLEFSAVYVTGLRMLGFRFTPEERDAIMHLWRYVAVVMGADDALLAHDYQAGLRQMVIHAVTNPHADADSRALAKALHELPARVTADKSRAEQLAARLHTRMLTAISRWTLGDEAVDDIGLPPARAKLLAPLVASRFAFETLRRRVPAITDRLEARGRRLQREVTLELLGPQAVAYVPYADRAGAASGRA